MSNDDIRHSRGTAVALATRFTGLYLVSTVFSFKPKLPFF